MCVESLSAAIAEAKGGKDVQRFEAAVSALRKIIPNDPETMGDQAWVEKTKRQVKAETEKMELELKGYKNNLIRESIRVCHSAPHLSYQLTHFFKMGHDDLGQHYHRIGELAKASKTYASMRDSCTTNAHIVMLNMHLINICIDQRAWFQAQNHINRLRGQVGGPNYPDAEKFNAKLSAAYGLCSMAQGNYQEAAREFIKTNPRMSQAKPEDPNDDEAYNEVLTPNDVAVYGGLCAMASMERDELQRTVLENSDFRNYLELEPHIRRAISFLINGKYAECLSILNRYKADYFLDIYLQPHLMSIYYDIRCRAIRQYFVPFSDVTIKELARVFNTDEEIITREATQLIKAGILDARIDEVDGVILARKKNARAKVHADALAQAKEYERTMVLRIFKMAVSNAGLEVKSPKDKGGNQGGGGGYGGSGDTGGFSVLGDLMGGGERSTRNGRGLG